MALAAELLGDGIQPIDIVESLAEHYDWEFDRLSEEQIAIAVEAQWRTYSLTLAWSAYDETLRLICTFEMEPPKARMHALYEIVNRINDDCWLGCFSWWPDQRLMVYRHGLLLAGGQFPSPEQVDGMLTGAVTAAERYYPAIQLATWGERSTEDAMQVAIAQAYGRA